MNIVEASKLALEKPIIRNNQDEEITCDFNVMISPSALNDLRSDLADIACWAYHNSSPIREGKDCLYIMIIMLDNADPETIGNPLITDGYLKYDWEVMTFKELRDKRRKFLETIGTS